MSEPADTTGDRALCFFGRITASISHELKNVLAIINENAGLMDDLAMLAVQGLPVEPERLKTISERIGFQVRRADGILRNMNAFSHSVDDRVKTVDLGEVVSLVTALSARLAAMRGVTLAASPPDSSVPVTTSPFLLQNLIFHCIDFATKRCGEGGRIDVRTGRGEAGDGVVTFRGLTTLGREDAEKLSTEQQMELLAEVHARITGNEAAEELILSVTGQKQ
ncbi:MAG: histidine kinase [Planctomycetota bacterium]